MTNLFDTRKFCVSFDQNCEVQNMTVTLRIGQSESPMRVSFKHASAERVATENIIVEIGENGICGYGEGCPRDYVTGETLQTVESFLLRHGREIAEATSDLCSLRSWINSHEALIDTNPAVFCSVELAALDLSVLAQVFSRFAAAVGGTIAIDGKAMLSDYQLRRMLEDRGQP